MHIPRLAEFKPDKNDAIGHGGHLLVSAVSGSKVVVSL